jgi:hypothetical protein
LWSTILKIILFLQCESLLEKHESDIENWYFHHQNQPLDKYLCVDRALRKGDSGCLTETPQSKESEQNQRDDNNNNEKQEL